VAIRITVWIGLQGLLSGFLAIGRYGKWLTDVNLETSSNRFARWRDWYRDTVLHYRLQAEHGLYHWMQLSNASPLNSGNCGFKVRW